jgi:ferrous iron transport protein B
MGLGCNAVGVMNSRIIPSKKQQLISILTNSFMPCNGRFPTLILLISVLLGGSGSSMLGAVLLTVFILLSIGITFAITFILSRTLKGENLSPTIELPPYRKPDILKTLADSFINKTLHILGRAIVVAAPAGAILWLINNIHIGDYTLLTYCASYLEPLGRVLCMDAVILLAFILGCPANEIVLPIAVMIYLGASSVSGVGNEEMKAIFLANGWDTFTCLSVILFSLFHWPCTTTLLTIKKETESLRYTAMSVLIPTVIGATLCILLNLIKHIFTG